MKEVIPNYPKDRKEIKIRCIIAIVIILIYTIIYGTVEMSPLVEKITTLLAGVLCIAVVIPFPRVRR